jgi:hypothetical protein
MTRNVAIAIAVLLAAIGAAIVAWLRRPRGLVVSGEVTRTSFTELLQAPSIRDALTERTLSQPRPARACPHPCCGSPLVPCATGATSGGFKRWRCIGCQTEYVDVPNGREGAD